MSVIDLFFLFFTLVPLVFLFVLWFIKPQLLPFKRISTEKLPFISVLVAARNEECNLPLLLKSLDQLDYPHDKLEIIFGDDHSTDRTANILKEYCLKTPYAHCYPILISTKQIAKANVLMQIARKAKGELFYFLDADIAPNSKILKNYAYLMQNNVAGVTGITLPVGGRLFGAWQRIDWCFALAMLVAAEKFGYPTTAMGNNMIIRKKDYDRIGGYEELPKSTVEDFIVYQALIKQGYSFPAQFTDRLLVATKPIDSFKNLLQQRKRWMRGGAQVHWFLQLVLGWQGLFYLGMIIWCFLNLKLALVVWCLKLLVQLIYHQLIFRRIKQKVSLFSSITYELYQAIFTCSLLLFYLLPIKSVWKGRSHGNY